MSKKNIKSIKLESGENPAIKISEEVMSAFKIFKGEGFLIVNRRSAQGFFEVFADSLYTYDRGIVLLERFFKKSKCIQKGIRHRQMKDTDIALLNEFQEFANAMPNAVDLTEEEKNNYMETINNYKERIKEITPEISILDTYRYDKFNLVEFDLTDDSTLELMSKMYSDFGLSFLTTFSWSSLSDVCFGITTIEHDDYIDLILLPIKVNGED